MTGRWKNDDRLLQTPGQIRNRLRRAHRNRDRAWSEKELQNLYATGFKPVHEWDMEELAHGRPRNKAGKFGGPIPMWITQAVEREVKRELHKRTFGRLASNVTVAVDVVRKLMLSEEVDDKGKPIVDARTKLAAATFVIEHVIGKAATILEIDPTDAAQKVFAAAIVLDDGKVDSHLAIEGELVTDDDDDEGPVTPVQSDDEDIYEMDDEEE